MHGQHTVISSGNVERSLKLENINPSPNYPNVIGDRPLPSTTDFVDLHQGGMALFALDYRLLHPPNLLLQQLYLGPDDYFPEHLQFHTLRYVDYKTVPKFGQQKVEGDGCSIAVQNNAELISGCYFLCPVNLSLLKTRISRSTY